MIQRKRSTPAGQHRAVLLQKVLEVLSPQPGEIVADCTLGWAGHGVELLRRVGPHGRVVGIDFDADTLPHARQRLEAMGFPFSLHQGNFAGLPSILRGLGIERANVVLADLGMSSMQVDDPERGFSYRRDGPLDMRMDRARGKTAAQILAVIPESELTDALRSLGDEPNAKAIAAAVVASRTSQPITRTEQLSRIIVESTQKQDWRLHPERHRWELHPAARTFQALRILVNRELASLTEFLRILPGVLAPAGRVAVITFHSGEDRLVKGAFRVGFEGGAYSMISKEPIRAEFEERTANPRARSAKLRWARRANVLAAP
jgi:16S rRNA (cytosine1402-N4)-methyltransferase